jgi:hypothetical protein
MTNGADGASPRSRSTNRRAGGTKGSIAGLAKKGRAAGSPNQEWNR